MVSLVTKLCHYSVNSNNTFYPKEKEEYFPGYVTRVYVECEIINNDECTSRQMSE